MQRRAIQTRLVLLLSLTAGAVVGGFLAPARAQLGAGSMSSMPSSSNPQSLSGGPPMIGAPAETKAPRAAPEALPGAAAHGDRVAPAQGGPIADPTEALFDAINRGDIASARDAIDRGADLGGHNVLGMTPLDLAVDLGRNDITFLLLSLRNGEARPNRRTAEQAGQTAQTGKPAPGHAPSAGRAATPGHPAVAARPQAAAARQAAPAAPVAPRLFANDGGAPNPGVGFLGFDNRH